MLECIPRNDNNYREEDWLHENYYAVKICVLKIKEYMLYEDKQNHRCALFKNVFILDGIYPR